MFLRAPRSSGENELHAKKNANKGSTGQNGRRYIARGKDFADVLFTSRNWVEKLHKMADAYNNTPKALTKVTPMEVHFPGQRMDSSKYFVLNAEDEKIVTELRQVCMVLKNERKKKEIS